MGVGVVSQLMTIGCYLSGYLWVLIRELAGYKEGDFQTPLAHGVQNLGPRAYHTSRIEGDCDLAPAYGSSDNFVQRRGEN